MVVELPSETSGLMLVSVGTGFLIVKVNGGENPPPDPGL